MTSRVAMDLMRRSVERASDRARGALPPTLRVAGQRAADVAIGDSSRLPAEVCAVELQAVTGEMVFLLGYSALDGPDVVV